MARTKGSGWGAGTILYQECQICGRKTAMYSTMEYLPPFKCIYKSCRERFYSDTLLHYKYVSQIENLKNKHNG